MQSKSIENTNSLDIRQKMCAVLETNEGNGSGGESKKYMLLICHELNPHEQIRPFSTL